jgi:hypothetical protein
MSARVIRGAVPIVAAVAAAVLLLSGCGNSATPVAQAQTPVAKASPSYYALIKPELTRLSGSSTAVAQVLSTAGRAQDLKRVKAVAVREMGVVQRLRTEVAETETPLSAQTKQRTLLKALSFHRQYLALIVRAVHIGGRGGVATLPAARSLAARASANYLRFFALEPAAPDLLSDSGMFDLSGLRSALESSTHPVHRTTTIPASSSPQGGVPTQYSGPFVAVDRLERCFATDSYVTCTAGPSGKGVTLSIAYGVTYNGVTGSADDGGFSMPIGTAFTTPGGTIRCASSTHGITCTDLTTPGYEFTIGDYRVVLSNAGQRYLR